MDDLCEQTSIYILLISILWATSGATYQRNKMILTLGFTIDVKKEKVFLWGLLHGMSLQIPVVPPKDKEPSFQILLEM